MSGAGFCQLELAFCHVFCYCFRSSLDTVSRSRVTWELLDSGSFLHLSRSVKLSNADVFPLHC